MENRLASPVLSPANDQAVYKYNNQLILLDDQFEAGSVLLEDVADASHFKWSLDGAYIAFIERGQLKVVAVANSQVMEVPLQKVSQFEWGANSVLYATSDEVHLYKWVLQGEAQFLLEDAVIEAYSAASQKAIVRRANQLFALQLSGNEIGELMEVTTSVGQYEQVAFSFDGQYVAYIGQTEAERHLYVYDFEMGITQNITEMLDVYAGDAVNPFTSCEQGVKEVQWIETDALYFLLSSDGDVRLYYADLFGSVFPASPESEHIVSYSVAKSGNWALYVADQPLVEARLDWFDITMGEGRTIVAQPSSVQVDFETYYEIVEAAGLTYYMWGYVPAQCEQVIVVLSERGRMLGNCYDTRLAEWLAENMAVVYVNQPGAIGYGNLYASKHVNSKEGAVQVAVNNWLLQKIGRPLRIEIFVK